MRPFSPARQASSRETAVSFGVLLVLAAVAAWLFVQQRHLSPAVSVAATAAAAANVRGVEPHTTAAPAPAADILTPLPAGLRAMSAVEAFTPATLSDKIDGKAELYLSASFVAMRCQRITSSANTWLEMFIYDMGSPEHAFAVYSSQKRNATEEFPIGDYGYRTGNQACIIHGPFYLEFVGADSSEATASATAALAKAFVAATPVTRHANMAKDESLFPAEGMVPGSVMLLSADVFGFDQLTNTYVARYQDGHDVVTLYLARRASPADATQLAAALRGFFINDCGGTEVAPPSGPAGAVIVDGGGAFDGVFACGVYVAGVHQAPSRESAARWMQQLAARWSAPKP